MAQGISSGGARSKPKGGVYKLEETRRVQRPFLSALEYSPEGKAYGCFARDVRTPEGKLVARAGERLSADLIQRLDLARSGFEQMQVPLRSTKLFTDLRQLLAHPIYGALFQNAKKRQALMKRIQQAPFPQALIGDMAALRRHSAAAYHQALVSSATAVLLLEYVVNDEEMLLEAAVAFTLRDVGLVQIPATILHNQDKLSPEQYSEYMTHELISAALIARATGMSLATRIGARHHRTSPEKRWVPYAEGYKSEEVEALLSVLAVADAFIGMISPRTFRITTYDTRGALDALLAGAQSGKFDRRVVELLVKECRKEESDAQVKTSTERRGRTPKGNRYGVEA